MKTPPVNKDQVAISAPEGPYKLSSSALILPLSHTFHFQFSFLFFLLFVLFEFVSILIRGPTGSQHFVHTIMALAMARGGSRGGLGGGRPPGKGPNQPGRAHQATGTSMREKFNAKVRAMISQGRPRVSHCSVSFCARF